MKTTSWKQLPTPHSSTNTSGSFDLVDVFVVVVGSLLTLTVRDTLDNIVDTFNTCTVAQPWPLTRFAGALLWTSDLPHGCHTSFIQ
jgi:hypothetical protein